MDISTSDEVGGMSVLTHAVLVGNIKLVKWLCAMGKDNPNVIDEFGFAPTHYACQLGNLPILKLLVQNNANLQKRTSEGCTPLFVAVIKGKRGCAEFLINDCKCDLLTTDNDGLNVFQRCCAFGELHMAKWLIEKGGFRPYVNVPTKMSYQNKIKQPLDIPDLSVSFAVTELYVHHMISQGHTVDLTLDCLNDEVTPAITYFLNRLNSQEAPLPSLTFSSSSSTQPQEQKPQNNTYNINDAPSVVMPGPTISKSPTNSPQAVQQFSQPVDRNKQHIEDDLPYDPTSFTPCIPLSLAQLVALRALSHNSTQFMPTYHIDFLNCKSIFFPAPTAKEIYLAALDTHTEEDRKKQKNKKQANQTFQSWEEHLPLYEPPDPGSLYILNRAYTFRNQVNDHVLYDKAAAYFGYSYAPKAQFSSAEFQTRQFFQRQLEEFQQKGLDIDKLSQTDHEFFLKIKRHFDNAQKAHRNDVTNVVDRVVEFASGCTPIMLAAGYGHQHVVDWLLKDCCVELLFTNSHGLKAWQIALRSRFIGLFIPLYEQSNANIDDLDRHGNTALLDAILRDDFPMVLFLLILGANPHFVDQNGKTLLMYATIHGNLDIARVLVDCKIDLSFENHDGHDVQTIAVSNSQWAIVKLLEDALESQAMAAMEFQFASEGGFDTNLLGLDEVLNIETIDWNSVMQAAQDLDIDVVDYCSRLGIDIKLLDKSGRNFLHHATLNGRFEQVKVLVEKGNMNIRAKQTKSFRIYAKATKGMNSIEMSLHKKWYQIFCYLFLETTLFHDTRPMDVIVGKYREVLCQLDAETIEFLASCSRDTLRRSPNPLLLSLRLVWLLTSLSDLDRIHRQLYTKLADKYNEYAVALIEAIPHSTLVFWILEEPDALSNTALTVAAKSYNMQFLSHHLVDKAVLLIWNGNDDPNSNSLFPISYLIRRPWMKRLLWDCALIARVVLFTIFLCFRVDVNETIDIVETLFYIFTLGQLLPPMPPTDRRLNNITAKIIPSGPVKDGQGNDQNGQRESSFERAAPKHPTMHQRMHERLNTLDQDNSVTNSSPSNNTSSSIPSKEFLLLNPKIPKSHLPTSNESQSSQLADVSTIPTLFTRLSIDNQHTMNSSISSTTAANIDSNQLFSPTQTLTQLTEEQEHDVIQSIDSDHQQTFNQQTDTNYDGTIGYDEHSVQNAIQHSVDHSSHSHSMSHIPFDQSLPNQSEVDHLQNRNDLLLRAQLTGKRLTKWQVVIDHLTRDGWALGDFVIAVVTLVLLIIRVLPVQSNPDGETARYTIYLICMSFLPMIFYWRLLQVAGNFEKVGTQLIIVYKMIADLNKFWVLFVMPMLVLFFQYWFLAYDPTYKQPADSWNSIANLFTSIYSMWWNQTSFDWYAYDDPRSWILIFVTIFGTFICCMVLFNLLVGLMAATLDKVMENSHNEYACQLVRDRWKLDQSLLQVPPPFSLIHLLLINIISSISKLPGISSLGPFRHQEDGLWCSYCGTPWSNLSFSITKPTNGADKRFPPYVLFEYSPQEAGKRLCHHCLRVQRLSNWYQHMSEWVAEMIIRALIFIPLTFYIILVFPFQLCASSYFNYKIKKEYSQGSKKLTSLLGITPYEYSYFQKNFLPPLFFSFEKQPIKCQEQLKVVPANLTSTIDDSTNIHLRQLPTLD